MEVFINKMQAGLKQGVRKLILIEEAWKAIAKEGMAEYIGDLFKTVRKFLVKPSWLRRKWTTSSSRPSSKESIITNSDCKIHLTSASTWTSLWWYSEDARALRKKENHNFLVNINNGCFILQRGDLGSHRRTPQRCRQEYQQRTENGSDAACLWTGW